VYENVGYLNEYHESLEESLLYGLGEYDANCLAVLEDWERAGNKEQAEAVKKI
jgi:hypothetical protein